MAREVGVHLKALQVDGGLTNSDVLAQLQADILGIPISKYFQLYYIYIIFIILLLNYTYIVFIILLLNYIYIRFTARYGSLVHAFWMKPVSVVLFFEIDERSTAKRLSITQ